MNKAKYQSWLHLTCDEMHNHGDDMNNKIGFLPDTIENFSFTDFFQVGEGLAKFGGFTLWTKSRVYFPIVSSNGVEQVISKLRDPTPSARNICTLGIDNLGYLKRLLREYYK